MQRRVSARARMVLMALTVSLLAGSALASTAAAADSFSVEAQEARKARKVCGLTVAWTRSIALKISIVPHGPDGIEYVSVLGDVTETFTNKAGVTASSFANVLEKDLHITDNGDGTATILELATGNATLYGPDGKAIARDPGQLRYLLYLDGDDVTFGGVVKDSTGRSDDFCTALVGALS
jgi:hypothetical protein